MCIRDRPVAGPAVVIEEMQKMMGMDKKVVDGTLRLVLTPAIGAALVTEEIDSSALRATLAAGEALCDG